MTQLAVTTRPTTPHRLARPVRLLAAVTLLVLTVLLGTVSTASASTAAPRAKLTGTTTVTTAPGIATTLISAGVLPLPTAGTGIGIGFAGGLTVSYRFPITGGNPDLTAGTGDIRHSGGIRFLAVGKSLEIGHFDISLAEQKIFAKQVNFAPGNIPVLDLDLSGLHVATYDGKTVLTGIALTLDPAAATALNSTFGLDLPAGLAFGSAKVVLG